jgi:MoaA/NifB/PqqE/SkfB family radical SAM enzyme
MDLKKRSFRPPQTICSLPWASVETTPNGEARVCCLSNTLITQTNGHPYNLKDHTLQEIFESDYMKNLRQNFLDGKKPSTCNKCWSVEEAGGLSKRILASHHLEHKEVFDEIDYSNIDPKTIQFLDLKLGNICNLKCRICGSWSSSKWASEQLDYLKKEGVSKEDQRNSIHYRHLQMGQWPRKTEVFWNEIESYLPGVKYFEFTGGEPMMIQEHFDVLRKSVELGYSKNQMIHYNTNGTHYPEKEIQELFPHFKSINVAFSVDDVEEKFEYQRYPAKWDEVNENIDRWDKIKQEVSTITTQVCCTISILNVSNLVCMAQWILTKNFNSWYFNMLHEPKHMSITALPKEVKEKIKVKVLNNNLPQKMHDELKNAVNRIDQYDVMDMRGFKNFRKEIDRTDLYRNQNFAKTFPELNQMLLDEGF